MVRRTDFNPHARGKFGGQAEARTKNFEDERIAGAHHLDATSEADAKRLEAICVLVIGADLAHHSANARGEFIKPHGGRSWARGVHDGENSVMPERIGN